MVDTDKKMAGKVKRQAARWHLVYYLRVFDAVDPRILGHLVNISEHGMMLISDNPIEIDKSYRLRMSLPNKMKDHDEISFTAICRWCKSDVDPSFYLSGFQLSGLDPVSSKLIATLIKDFSQNT